MIARVCVSCKAAAPDGGCGGRADCGNTRPPVMHDHDYDEWWCRACWAGFSPAEREDADAYEVRDDRPEREPVEFGAGAKWR